MQPKFSNANSAVTPIIEETVPHSTSFATLVVREATFPPAVARNVSEPSAKNVASDPSSDQDSFPDTDENKDYFVGAVHQDEKAPPSPLNQDLNTYSVNTLTEDDWLIAIETNGSIIPYKIDTGAQVNILSKADYQRVKQKSKLHKPTVKLSAYNGSAIPVVGKSVLNLNHKGRSYPVLFIILDIEATPILGLTTCSHLNLIKRIMHVDKDMHEIMTQQFQDCFGEIGKLCKRVSQRIGVISRFRNIMPTNAKLTIYKTAILSHLTYCSTVWHFCKVADKIKIERIQEKALRVVYCDKSTPYAQLLIKANLPSLENRRLQDIAILMYKVKYGSAPQPIKDIFTIKETHYELRNNNFIIPKFCTVKYGKNSIRYFGPYLWSRLEKKLKELPTMNHFKRNIRGMDIVTLLDRRL